MSTEIEELIITFTDQTPEQACERVHKLCSNVAVWVIVHESGCKCTGAVQLLCDPCKREIDLDAAGNDDDMEYWCNTCGDDIGRILKVERITR